MNYFSNKIFIICILKVTLLNLSCHKNQIKPFTKSVAYLQLKNSKLVVEEIVNDLEVPWDIDISRPNEMWYSQQKGLISKIDLQTGLGKEIFQIPDVLYKKSYGLLGMAIHPYKPYIFVHYTYSAGNDGIGAGNQLGGVSSRLVRYEIKPDTLINPLILLDSIPGNTYHNGSRIVISPTDKIFISMGDVGTPEDAQDPNSLAGKIIRLNIDGSVPKSNPIPNNPLWTLGHRNPQGLVFAADGTLYSSEHGPNNDDEINIIEPNHNYGWPKVMGLCDMDFEKIARADNEMTDPIYQWTPTIAPAGLAYYNNNNRIPEWKNSLLLANLKGRALRVLGLSKDGKTIEKEHIFLQKKFGRIRDVAVAKNGDIYFATSNKDWHPRFQPWMYDSLPPGLDRIIRIRPLKMNEKKIDSLPTFTENLKPIDLETENWNPDLTKEYDEGSKLYFKFCASCHGPVGQGSKDLIPPLAGTEWVTGDKSRLIQILLKGLSHQIEVNGEMYDQEMPSFMHLSDQQLADLSTYIRNSFGNESIGVIAGEIYEERRLVLKK